jgi:hypothetical protein
MSLSQRQIGRRPGWQMGGTWIAHRLGSAIGAVPSGATGADSARLVKSMPRPTKAMATRPREGEREGFEGMTMSSLVHENED